MKTGVDPSVTFRGDFPHGRLSGGCASLRHHRQLGRPFEAAMTCLTRRVGGFAAFPWRRSASLSLRRHGLFSATSSRGSATLGGPSTAKGADPRGDWAGGLCGAARASRDSPTVLRARSRSGPSPLGVRADRDGSDATRHRTFDSLHGCTVGLHLGVAPPSAHRDGRDTAPSRRHPALPHRSAL